MYIISAAGRICTALFADVGKEVNPAAGKCFIKCGNIIFSHRGKSFFNNILSLFNGKLHVYFVNERGIKIIIMQCIYAEHFLFEFKKALQSRQALMYLVDEICINSYRNIR